MSRFFGPVRQIGYVSRDAFASMRMLTENAGVGPWYFFQSEMDIECQGDQSKADLLIAFANSGTLQIELIEQRNDGKTAFSLAADTIPGLHIAHHYAFWPTDYDASVVEATKAGLTVLQNIHVSRGRVSYWQGADARDMIVELAETTPGRQRIRDMVAAAARDWDGADPYRELP